MRNNESEKRSRKDSKQRAGFSKSTTKKINLSRSKKTARLISKRFDEVEQSRTSDNSKKIIRPSFQKTEKKITGDRSSSKSEVSLVRLNKFIANSGICSRREADNLITAGAVKVNGIVVTELGTKINIRDKVQIGEQTLKPEKLQYVLLNKPKGYITTTDDPEKRNTVMILVEKACKERIYPVGRLDRNTTGLLLFTNDGDLAKKLTHPRSRIAKLYHVYLNKSLTRNDMIKIGEGLELEDGFIKVDGLAYVGDGADKKDIGIELHSGKNRIVRRIFESLSYDVVKLDRVIFAGLTKKDLPRGKFRHLTPKEVAFIKKL